MAKSKSKPPSQAAPSLAHNKSIETLTHDEAKRRNIPTAEYQPVLHEKEQAPIRVAYQRRNKDLDPQLVWRGKGTQDASDLFVQAPPLYIQEKVHAKALVDDLVRQSKERANEAGELTADLFADFNGIPKGVDKTEFYQHDQNWSNRMILGDSLQVMASLAEREGLRGKVQCIYFDPPYGIKFNSNFQWSTTSRDVKDGQSGHITREPEQVKAFRDTWRDGIHSYLSYLRDRLMACRDLLADSGSLFVQISDVNEHHVRELLDEVFGAPNYISTITFKKTSTLGERFIGTAADYLLWYGRDSTQTKYRPLYKGKGRADDVGNRYTRIQLPDGSRRPMTTTERQDPESLPPGARIFRHGPLVSQTGSDTTRYVYRWRDGEFSIAKGGWKTNRQGMDRLSRVDRLAAPSIRSLASVIFLDDFQAAALGNVWTDTQSGAFTDEKVYVVQTNLKVVQRCILMTTDPGDLVLDPTCGSGTTATVAEQWGRRWITIDTSRVALALARSRIMGARYPYYLLADSREGQVKEAEITQRPPSTQVVRGSIRQGFVCERVPHIGLRSLTNNVDIDVIWDTWQAKLEPVREKLNATLKKKWQEWEIPREAEPGWSATEQKLHADWWEARIARQKAIDASIASKADFEKLYDKPYEDKRKVRVAGPFTVESLSPHRSLGLDPDDDFIRVEEGRLPLSPKQTFEQMVLQNLKTAGVQQAHKEDRIAFTSLTGWPGRLVCGEGRYLEGGKGSEKRAAIFIGPEYGTVTRPDLVEVAREAADARFDLVVACGFNFEAHTTEFASLGKIPVLKARMNADLHMAEDLKNTGKGNLFVVFGEPDITIEKVGKGQVRVKLNGVDVFDPTTGEVRSDGAEGIACWFIDTDYNQESFFVRHAYFLGANDPYSSLKTTLRAEVDREAWESLHSDTSRAFDKPKSGRIAVKVINHLGDEVMKVFRVE
jgi:adenine-specific DNA-methyltransferase